MFNGYINGGDSTYYRGEQYTSLEFQSALIPYKATFNSSQTRRLLSAIKKYREFSKQTKNKSYQERLTTITFNTIKNQRNNISSKDPLLTVYFSANENDEHFMVFSIGRIQKDVALKPEVFYLDDQSINDLEEILQMSYLAQK